MWVQMPQKVSFKQCLFDRNENPGIQFFQDRALWIFTHIPDLSLLTGWRMLLLRLFGFAYMFSLLGWLIAEGVTLTGIIVRMTLMSLVFGVVYARLLAGMCFGVLQKWETFK